MSNCNCRFVSDDPASSQEKASAQRSILNKVIETFRSIQKRPQMFLSEVSEQAFWNYQAGFYCAWNILRGVNFGNEYREVCDERGWRENSLGPQKHMRNAGWTETAIVEELITIEILTWERVRDTQAEAVASSEEIS